MKEYVDMHIHTTASDGELSSSQIVEQMRNQVSALSITDHDSVDGIKEAQIACKLFGIEFISGIEISRANSKTL